MTQRIAICLISALVAGMAAAEDRLPAVPTDVVADAENSSQEPPVTPVAEESESEEPLVEAEASEDLDPDDLAEGETDQNTVAVQPGVNEIIPISRGHLNRIVTPYREPVIRTTSEAETTTEGGVIYVATSSESPTTMFVSEKGQQDQAISLTLVPKSRPPVEWRLEWEGAGQRRVGAHATSDLPTGKQQEYVTRIRNVMRALAKRKTPQGFSEAPWPRGIPFDCDARLAGSADASNDEGNSEDDSEDDKEPGEETRNPWRLDISQGIHYQGRDLEVYVTRLVNEGDQTKEFEEQTCAGPGVAAVAAWPRVLLAPGEATELFVVIHNQARQQQDRGDRRQPLAY